MNTNNITARNAAIREALNAGRTYAEITSQFHVSSKTVSKIASGAEFGGKRGRPRALNDEMLRFIEEVSLADARVTDGEMVSLVHSRFDVTVSRSTVAAARNELGFRYRPPMTRQLLSETQVTERLEFSRAIINGEEQAPNIVFSDESRFEKSPDNTWRRMRRGCWNDTCFAEKTKYSPGVMVWAAIAVGWRSPLCVCCGSVNSGEYCRILEASGMIREMNDRHGVGNWTLMQDGAPAHLSRSTMEWLRQQHVAVLPGWPANSPDLNPIENLWAILKRQLKKHEWQKSEDVAEVLQRAWAELDEGMINRLVLSFSRRCSLVAALGGRSASQHVSSHRFISPETEVVREWDATLEQRVMDLVEIHGTKWKEIGNLLDCDPKTVKYLWQRAQQRHLNELHRNWRPLPPISDLVGAESPV